MPSKTRAVRAKKGQGSHSQSQASGSDVTLQSFQQRFEEKGSLGDTNEERRRAW